MAATVDSAAAERIARTLEHLHDIIEPAPPPLWPPAPGWIFVMAGLVLLLIVIAHHGWRRWQANAYRRQARCELATLKGTMESVAGSRPANAEQISELAILLRRVALHGMPREQIAALSGDVWIRHLVARAGIAPIPAVAAVLCRGPYASPTSIDDMTSADIRAAFDYVGAWIDAHRAPQEPPR